MSGEKKLLEAAEYAAEAARRAGAEEADAYLTSGARLSVNVFKGKIELFENAVEAGAGIRAFRGNQMGFSYTTDMSPAGLDAAAGAAFENAALSDPDAANGLPENAGAISPAEKLVLTDPDYTKATTADKIAYASRLEKTALKSSDKVMGCDNASYSEEEETVALANTRGFSGSYKRQACFGYVGVLAGAAGEVQTGFSYGYGRSLADLDAEREAAEAVDRAVSMLGAKPIPTATMTVVFDPLVFIQILTAVLPAFSAEAAQKGRSFLSGREGRRIAPDYFSLVDNGRLPAGLASYPFDDEGIASRETRLIDLGTLDSFLYNTYAARKEGRPPTGNGRRGSFRTLPGTSPSNIFVESGAVSPAEIIAGIGDGLYVMGLQGMHAGVSAVTGQFSAGAYGIRIRNGEKAEAVREITIASTCSELLKNIVAVGSDLRFMPMASAYGSPTIAIGGVVVSGL